MANKVFLLTAVIAILLCISLASFVKSKNKNQSATQTSPMLQADPTIFYHQGTYYLYGTSSDDGFLVYQSKDLKSWSGPVGKQKGYALLKRDAFGDKGFWAPQVFTYKNKFYMAYTANEQIAVAQSDSPLGPFKQNSIKPITSTGKQIDPYIFFDSNGKPYLYYVKLQEGNRIFVSAMDTELRDIIPGTAKECLSATARWENTESRSWPVAEGPTVFKIGKYYFMMYSANDYRSKDYAVGYATALSPTGPWNKFEGNPIISRTTVNQNGTGHGDLFKDEAGRCHYVMHTHFSDTKVSPRKTGLIDLTISEQNNAPAILKTDGASFKFLNVSVKP